MDECPHFLLVEPVAGHDAQKERFVVVGNVTQVRSQAVKAVVALTRHGLPSRQAEPAGDEVGIRDALERELIYGIARRITGGRYASNVLFVGFRFLHFPLTKQFRFVQVKDVVGRHGKRAPRIVLHALVVGAVVQLMRHPALGFLQPHARWDDKKQAESFGRRCDVGQHDAQLANPCGHVLAEKFARGRDMVHIVHRQTAGHGIGVQATSARKRGMRGKDGKLLLAFTFQGIEIFRCHFAAPHRLKCIGYLGTYPAHQRRVDYLVEELGGTYAHHPASDIVAYSKHIMI